MTNNSSQGRVLIIAGSDSGGGAGVQADIKAVTMLGGYAATAITAITVQNTMGVFGVHEIPPRFVADQVRVVMEDIGADAVKTGMLASVQMVETVADALDTHARGVPLVVDPVMIAKGGETLIEDRAVDAIKMLLTPRCALITPNAPEAERLTGVRVEDMFGQRRAGEAILKMGAGAVLVKGGHVGGDIVHDVLVTPQGVTVLEGPRIITNDTHGTGCTLASAIAALLAQGIALPAAAEGARDYLMGAIRNAPGFGQGHGPLKHNWTLA